MKKAGEIDNDFVSCLEDWDITNNPITSWLHNTSSPSINMKFVIYETIKKVWKMFTSHYAGSKVSSRNNSAKLCQLKVTFYRSKHMSRELIPEFHSRMCFLCNQLALSKSSFT